MSYLHGAEVLPQPSFGPTITSDPSTIIGLAGIAPKGTPNKVFLVQSPKAAVDIFGEQLPGFSIPQALDAIFKQGGGPVLVVNIFDPATMVTQVTDEAQTVVGGKCKTTNTPTGPLVVKNQAGTVTYTQGIEYTADAFGNVRIIAVIAEGASLRISYARLNTAAVTPAAVAGTITAGVYTGMKLFRVAQNEFGVSPKILIAPEYCTQTAVATELEITADLLGGQAIIDSPAGTLNPATAITQRGLAGTWAGFKSVSKRLMLVYPNLRVQNVLGVTVTIGASAYIAGAWSKSIRDRGVHFSPSNIALIGVLGLETTISARLDDINSDTNLLNAAGITTFFQGFGTGLRTWGNRSASFPNEAGADTFVSIQLTRDLIESSIERASSPFVDQPINDALVDSVRGSVIAYFNQLTQAGTILGGDIRYNKDSNPATQLAAGRIVFEISFMPPGVAERITFNSTLDINLLSTQIAQ